MSLMTHLPLNDLLVKRNKTREEAIRKFTDEGLASVELSWLSDYNLVFTAEFEALEGLPQITFKLKDESLNEIATFILDGWSGCMIVNDKRPEIAYSGPHELRKAVIEEAVIYLDKTTNPY